MRRTRAQHVRSGRRRLGAREERRAASARKRQRPGVAARVRSLSMRGGENARDDKQRCKEQQDEEPDADARDERHRARTMAASPFQSGDAILRAQTILRGRVLE